MTKDEQERSLAGLYDKREKLVAHLEDLDQEIDRVRNVVLEEVQESNEEPQEDVKVGAESAEGKAG